MHGGITETTASVFGSFRVLSATNLMSSRQSHSAAIDLRSNRIYFAGGKNLVTNYLFSDVWVWDMTTNSSALIGGLANPNPLPALHPAKSWTSGAVLVHRLGFYDANLWVDPSGGMYYGFGEVSIGSTILCNGHHFECYQ
jgi:hypothetical protein